MRDVSRIVCLLAAWLVVTAVPAWCLEVRMAGDGRIYGNFFLHHNYTGWNADGTQTEDPVNFYQRFRLRTDFVTHENLSFRLGFRVDDENWGHGTFTVDAPEVSIEVYLAYLQFKWPDTDIQVTAGYQPVSMPATEAFYDSLIMANDDGDQSTSALVLTAPVFGDVASLNAGFTRFIDTNGAFDTDTTQVADEFDAFFLTAPITLDALTFTPWGMAGIMGKGSDLGDMDTGLRSAGSYLPPDSREYNQTAYWWAGTTLEVKAFDPVKISMDFAYGSSANALQSSRRRGWFADAAIEYTGLSFMTPGIYGWAASGENASLSDGSERIPVVMPKWGPATSFLFDCDQALSDAAMETDATGTMGFALALKDISVIEDLTSRLTFAMVFGANSAAGIRRALAVTGGNGGYMTMGQTLAVGEQLVGVNFDHYYDLYENLTLTLETGYAQGIGFQSNIWGHRFAAAASPAWKCGLGMTYTF
ncbi:outer membrane homotrimeric porin [Desulfovibrio sulfodismutans]|uniref:Outer membrane homotrimeric porin n=1 Tax=Desulfolutivibrio sulfodismutans TaxID=63561 RepID=A0A7K3NM93_9BACT|nr:outer membrane homotrimeric porin [Desulfolutivibrio sulfodismutans]NDY57322.1 outer membrane homotrimeric porin [Desulfolutivibrio sulfodismutans]QLA13935.1 outer membrane homotrimeric porin [Desulfolutivibrio sulfodismutans DSM 3696]